MKRIVSWILVFKRRSMPLLRIYHAVDKRSCFQQHKHALSRILHAYLSKIPNMWPFMKNQSTARPKSWRSIMWCVSCHANWISCGRLSRRIWNKRRSYSFRVASKHVLSLNAFVNCNRVCHCYICTANKSSRNESRFSANSLLLNMRFFSVLISLHVVLISLLSTGSYNWIVQKMLIPIFTASVVPLVMMLKVMLWWCCFPLKLKACWRNLKEKRSLSKKSRFARTRNNPSKHNYKASVSKMLKSNTLVKE